MPNDLSTIHQLITGMFATPSTAEEWAQYRLSDERVSFFHEHGYVAGIRMLTESQVDGLCGELNELMDPGHPRHHLFYEYHTNESIDSSKILFHALGAWRIAPGFHDLLWNPASTLAAAQLLGGAVRFWHDQLFCKPARHGGVVASFHHPRMIHGSYANDTNRPRRATVINVFRDGVRSASDEPLLKGVPPIRAGEKISGKFFPLLFDPHTVDS